MFNDSSPVAVEVAVDFAVESGRRRRNRETQKTQRLRKARKKAKRGRVMVTKEARRKRKRKVCLIKSVELGCSWACFVRFC